MFRRKEMGVTRVALVTGLIVLMSFSSGCMWAPELSRLRNDIEDQIPGTHFDREFAISLGPVTLGLARLITGLVPDDDARNARQYLRDVSSIQVAIYKTESPAPVEKVRMPNRLRQMCEHEGWDMAVKAREDDSLAWVLYRITGDSIKDIYVVVLDDEELVMVRAHGKLDRLVARALHEAEGTRGVPRVPDDSS